MLDENETPTEQPTSQPRPRRRAASRPSGPPPTQPVVDSTTADPGEATQAATVTSEVAPEGTKPKRASRARKPAAKAAEPPAAVASGESGEDTTTDAPDAGAASAAPKAKAVKKGTTTGKDAVTASRKPARTPDGEGVAAPDAAEADKPARRSPARKGRAQRPALAENLGLGEEATTGDVLDSLAAAIGGQTEVEPEASESESSELAEVVSDPAGQDSETGDAGEGGASDAGSITTDPDTTDSEAADSDAADGEAADGDSAEGEPGQTRRRRRRRGGRRRRRSSGDSSEDGEGESDSADESSTDDDSESAESDADDSDDSGDEAEPSGEGTTRRRRRRRRRGEDTSDTDDDSVDVVVRVREPRKRGGQVSDEVTGIEGSTRMEAKRQRRREGRAAGRRRTPILSESEFLARRESVDRRMLIRQAEDYSQLAVMEDGVLVEHYVDRASATSMIGNIYLGRVQNVLPSMEAAFIDIGRGRNAVLYAGEVDWASFGEVGQGKKVEQVFKSGQSVLVQVSKDPVGAKGARLTSHISIPGRYIVYSPGGHLSGISRKLPEGERRRLKEILDGLIDPEASVIVRTAAEGASEEELVRDVNRLKAQWEVLQGKIKSGQAPKLLYAEPDLTVRIVRDLFTEDFGSLVIDGSGKADDAFESVDAYVRHVAPHLVDRLVRWDRVEQGDIFNHYRVHEQVAKALERKVFLPSGGSLIIDRTEAMTVIDVNTGKFTGTQGNLEATVTANNLEAAEEIVRQLRLRDIGGIIVIDFIDMVLPSNRELLLRRLVECLGRDRTRHQVAEVTSLGLVQMTRKKIGTGLAEAFTVSCETCKGRGYHVHDAPVPTQSAADGGDRQTQRGGRSTGGRQPGRTNSNRPRPTPPAEPSQTPAVVETASTELEVARVATRETDGVVVLVESSDE